MRSPRVLMLTYRFHPVIGGAEIQCLRLSRALVQQGYTTCVLTERLIGTHKQELIDGVPVLRLGGLDWWRTLLDRMRKIYRLFTHRSQKTRTYKNGREIRRQGIFVYLYARIPERYFKKKVYRYLNRHAQEFDVIHVHGAHWLAATAVRFSSCCGKKVIVKESGSGHAMTIRNQTHEELSMTLKADRFVAVSSQLVKDLKDIGLPNEKIVMIPNGIDIPERCWENVDDPMRQALFVGNLTQMPHKGLDVLFHTWKRLNDRGISHGLRIIGNGDPSAMKELAEELGILHQITFVGPVTNVADYLLSSSMFILPSRDEGLSNALLEAMAYGVPCIATNISGSQDLIRDKENGVLVPREDPDTLGDAIAYLLEKPAERARLGEAARDTIRWGFSMTSIADAYIKLYKEMVTECQGSITS